MEKMEPGSDNEPDLSVRTSVAKQFKIQHINHEMNKSIITHIFETTCGYHEAGPPVLNHLSECEK